MSITSGLTGNLRPQSRAARVEDGQEDEQPDKIGEFLMHNTSIGKADGF